MRSSGPAAAVWLIVMGGLLIGCAGPAPSRPSAPAATASPAPSAAQLTSSQPPPPTQTPLPTALPSTVQGWSVTGSMMKVREYHTTTLLVDGRVLVAGGLGPIADVELYAPASGSWSATGKLAQARRFHTATRLLDGTVLVSGGLLGSGGPDSRSLATVELYDPGSGVWRPTGSLLTPRDHHTATLMADGRVLVVGGAEAAAGARGNGEYSGRLLASAELYDPATGTWTATGSLRTARESHFAMLLEDGRVLVVGGLTVERGKFTERLAAELYDPIAGTWTVAGLPGLTRIDTATLLGNGTVLMTGGDSGLGAGSSAELYDPSAGAWTPTASMHTARSHSTATLLSDGQVLVTGGQSDKFRTLASTERYDPNLATWASTGHMAGARFSHEATVLTDGRVLVAGGETLRPAHLFLNSAELFDPGSHN